MSRDTRAGDRHTGPRQRSVRGIDDDLWQAAQEKARKQGTTVSGVVREFMERWVKEK